MGRCQAAVAVRPDGAVTLATRILRQTTSSFPEIATALARVADGRGLVPA
ncbi:hypothetical protein ACWEVD_01375 [Nocardia thailandica]